MKLTWLGWASWLIETNNKKIYIDPFKGSNLEKADIILSSHNHPDHCDLEQIKNIRTDATKVITGSAFANAINAESLDIGQTKTLGSIKITAVPAYNLKIPNHQKNRDTGFIIETENKRIYFAADTDYIEEMSQINNIDVALLPIGGTFTMDVEGAANAVKTIRPKIVIPMHYGSIDIVFGGKPMHVEFKPNLDEFAEKANRFSKTIILKEGQKITI
jgi:L-ascorbate metabolism protein UlaG (beta-lactamase superfamily)